MDSDSLLRIARDIIAKVPMCMVITVDQNGEANARVVQPSKLSDAWTVRFMTDRRSRKVIDLERSSKMTISYQYDTENAYVSLVGHAVIIDDIAAKQAVWQPASFKWHPGGPTDPNVALIEFSTSRV